MGTAENTMAVIDEAQLPRNAQQVIKIDMYMAGVQRETQGYILNSSREESGHF